MAAAQGIAFCVSETQLNPDYILPYAYAVEISIVDGINTGLILGVVIILTHTCRVHGISMVKKTFTFLYYADVQKNPSWKLNRIT